MLESFKELWIANKQEYNGWAQPYTYLLKTLDLATYVAPQNFVENLAVPVTFLAIVLIPDKVVLGLCFPDCYPNAFRCPNVTLLTH
jgi:hypothetical protein